MNRPDCGVINPHNTAGRTDSSPARQSGSIHLRGLKGRNNCCREGGREKAQEVKQNPGEKTSGGFSAMFSSSASGNESTRGGEEVELRSLFAGVALRH